MNDKHPVIQRKKGHRRWLFLLTAILTLVVAAIVVKKTRTAYVEVGEVKKGRIVEAVYGLGTVTAHHTYQVKLGLTGKVRKVFVREGDMVKKGAALVSVEGATTFSAPFDATVTSVAIKEGETVYPQLALVGLTDLGHSYIVVSLDQRAAMKVRKGLPVTLSFEGNRDKPLAAKVASIYPNEGQFLVRIDSDSLPASALPGMTVDVAIQVGEKEGVMIAPVSAVQKDTVLVGASRKAVKVTTGLVDGSSIEITSGDIKEGDRVFVRSK